MKKTGEIRVESKNPYKITVLLAYDSAPTCGAILRMFDRISTRLRDKKIFNLCAFEFGLLERMDSFRWPSAKAGAAELVLVAFGEKGAPGAGPMRWLENWAQQHAGQDSALGFLALAAEADEPVRRFVGTLQTMAESHGLRFICGAKGGFDLLQAGGTAAA